MERDILKKSDGVLWAPHSDILVPMDDEKNRPAILAVLAKMAISVFVFCWVWSCPALIIWSWYANLHIHSSNWWQLLTVVPRDAFVAGNEWFLSPLLGYLFSLVFVMPYLLGIGTPIWTQGGGVVLVTSAVSDGPLATALRHVSLARFTIRTIIRLPVFWMPLLLVGLWYLYSGVLMFHIFDLTSDRDAMRNTAGIVGGIGVFLTWLALWWFGDELKQARSDS